MSFACVHAPIVTEKKYRLALSLFLTNLEIPIVTTSLVAITDSLGGFDQVGWIISSYLLGYVGWFFQLITNREESTDRMIRRFGNIREIERHIRS